MTYRTDPGSYGLGRHLANMEAADWWKEHHCHVCERCEEKYEAVRELKNFIGRQGEVGLPSTGLYKLEDEAGNIIDLIDEACWKFPLLFDTPPQDLVHDLRANMKDMLEWLEASLPESSCDYHTDCGQH